LDRSRHEPGLERSVGEGERSRGRCQDERITIYYGSVDVQARLGKANGRNKVGGPGLSKADNGQRSAEGESMKARRWTPFDVTR
jgi:hypothetical protein